MAAHKDQVLLTIDGLDVVVPTGTTIFDAARMHGINIPVLCHQQDEPPVGACRMCVVDVKERVYAAACIRKVEPNHRKANADAPDLVVETKNDGVRAARKTLLELLMADHPAPCIRERRNGDCQLEKLAREYGATQTPYARRQTGREIDDSSQIILVDHAACILCDRCIRACADLRHNYVIARRGKGYNAEIAFDLGKPMGSSSCVSCGECMFSCPTGALTNRVSLTAEFESGSACTTEELLAIPIFQHVSSSFLNFNRGSIVKRRVRQGEFFYREGEGSFSAFYILEGQVNVFVSTQPAHVETEEQTSPISRRMRSNLVPSPEESQGTRQLGPNTLFGEISCLNSYPHSATAQAATDCLVLEMRHNVLDALHRNKTFREKFDNDYLTRTFESHLRQSPVFSELQPDFIKSLLPKVRLERYAPGEVIFKQGDLADCFYLVRRGFVKVVESHPTGDIVLAYLPMGSHFGVTSLLGEGMRLATCSALDNVDLVRIAEEDFKEMLKVSPEIYRHIEEIRDERHRENQQRFAEAGDAPLNEFLRQGIMEAKSLLVLDLEKCTRCDQCVKACADAHDGVTRLVRDGLRLEHFLVATSCRHCLDPLCMVCPVGAIQRQPSLDILIDNSCIGCGECAKNCPYGNINMHEFEVVYNEGWSTSAMASTHTKKKATVSKATNCNLCAELKEPSCVYACPHDAAHRVSGKEFNAMLVK
jgi:CRP-like cAMP-binding protein/Fe-S-cluster-containing hydrogenase component 2